MKHYRYKQLASLWQDYLSSWPLPQADRWLAASFKSQPKFGKQDRKFYADMLFAALRHGLFALYCHELNLFGKLDLSTWAEAHTDAKSLWQKIKALPAEAFFPWVALRAELAWNLSAEQQAQYQQIKQQLQQDERLLAKAIWHSLPVNIVEPIHQRQKLSWNAKDLAEFFSLQDSRPPLWLRLQQPELKSALLAELAAHRLSLLTERPLSHATALAVQGELGIYQLPAYKQGKIEIQDLASQLIGDEIAPENPKPLVLDACAGGGGKTMQIAARLNNRGAIYALDIRDYKLEEIKRRARKGGFFNIRPMVWDWSQNSTPNFPKEVSKQGGFDWVLVDAPCTSAGTWRRNPDAKWRLDLSQLPALCQLQLQILSQAARCVKPTGKLVYATCSFLPDENEQIIQQFLQANPTFVLGHTTLLGAPQDNSDTMFVAVLNKKETS